MKSELIHLTRRTLKDILHLLFFQDQIFSSGIRVRLNQAKIWFFVAYLGLLTNLGPSLHHANFLGFHSHAGGDCCHFDGAHTHCTHSHSAHSHHAHSHCDHTHECHTHRTTEPSNELMVHAGANGHDCPFCKFFDQFHVIVEANESTEFSEIALVDIFEQPSELCSVIFIPVARGPPAAV